MGRRNGENSGGNVGKYGKMSHFPNLARNVGYHLSWIGAAVMYVIMQYFKSNDGDWVLGYRVYIYAHSTHN
jgi:hypothetical protein